VLHYVALLPGHEQVRDALAGPDPGGGQVPELHSVDRGGLGCVLARTGRSDQPDEQVERRFPADQRRQHHVRRDRDHDPGQDGPEQRPR